MAKKPVGGKRVTHTRKAVPDGVTKHRHVPAVDEKAREASQEERRQEEVLSEPAPAVVPKVVESQWAERRRRLSELRKGVRGSGVQ